MWQQTCKFLGTLVPIQKASMYLLLRSPWNRPESVPGRTQRLWSSPCCHPERRSEHPFAGWGCVQKFPSLDSSHLFSSYPWQISSEARNLNKCPRSLHLGQHLPRLYTVSTHNLLQQHSIDAKLQQWKTRLSIGLGVHHSVSPHTEGLGLPRVHWQPPGFRGPSPVKELCEERTSKGWHRSSQPGHRLNNSVIAHGIPWNWILGFLGIHPSIGYLHREGEERQPEQRPNLRNRKRDETCYSAGIIQNGHLTMREYLGAFKNRHRRGTTVKWR